jgi:hypothetical protein
MILTPVAIVGAKVLSVRVEPAAVAIDVALISPDDLTGTPEIRTILLKSRRIARRPVLPKLLLVLPNGLTVAVAILPVAAEVTLVLPNVSRVLSHVLAVLAHVALVAPKLAPVLLYLRIGNGSGSLGADVRDPDGHRQRPGHCHGFPSIHVVLPWVSNALHPSDAGRPAIVYPSGRARGAPSTEPSEITSLRARP